MPPHFFLPAEPPTVKIAGKIWDRRQNGLKNAREIPAEWTADGAPKKIAQSRNASRKPGVLGKGIPPADVAEAVLRRKPHPPASEFYAYRLWKDAPFFRISGAFSLPKTLAPLRRILQAETPPAWPKHPSAPRHPVHAALRSTGQNAPCKDFEMECGFAAKSGFARELPAQGTVFDFF